MMVFNACSSSLPAAVLFKCAPLPHWVPWSLSTKPRLLIQHEEGKLFLDCLKLKYNQKLQSTLDASDICSVFDNFESSLSSLSSRILPLQIERNANNNQVETIFGSKDFFVHICLSFSSKAFISSPPTFPSPWRCSSIHPVLTPSSPERTAARPQHHDPLLPRS